MNFKCVSIAGLLAIIFVAGCSKNRNPEANEPSYQGKSLSEWLTKFDNYERPEGQNEAAEAVRHIGSAAVPFLVNRLSESRAENYERELQKWQETQASTTNPASRPPNPRIEGLAGLDALGSEASSALLALEKLLHDDPPDPAALYVIARIGPAGGPILEKYRNSDVRILKLEANICLEMIASHSEILYPKIPVGPDAPSYNRRICDFNLQVLHGAFLEYSAEHPETSLPPKQ